MSPSRVAVALGLLFALVSIALTWAEHETYNSTSLDMAAYTQVVWNTAAGHPFETTLLLQNRLHLAEHLALLLFPLAPLYGLLPDVKLLLLLQQGALALSGAPVYWLARRRLGSGLALLCLGGYYAMPTLGEVALDAFYPIAFAALPLGWAAALAITDRGRSSVLTALLGVLVEEEAALAAIGVALYLLPAGQGSRRAGIMLVLTGSLWLGGGEFGVMPRYQQPPLGGAETRPEAHFSQLRADPVGWVFSVGANRLEPDLVRSVGDGLAARVAPCPEAGHCSALRWWLYPTAGLALLSPPVLTMAAPTAAALLLADRPGRFRRHWAAPMLPIIWLAAALGLSKLSRHRLRLAGGLALAAGILIMYRLDSSMPLGSQFESSDVVWSAVGVDLSRFRAQIPDQASVAGSRRGLAHLANRRELYVFPPKDYRPGLWPPAEPPSFVLLDLRNGETLRELEGGASPLRPTSDYRELERSPNALLLERSAGTIAR